MPELHERRLTTRATYRAYVGLDFYRHYQQQAVLMIDVSFATLSSYDLNMRHVLRCVIDFFHAVISQCRSMGKGNGSYIASENIKMLTKNDDRHADLLFRLWQASLCLSPRVHVCSRSSSLTIDIYKFCSYRYSTRRCIFWLYPSVGVVLDMNRGIVSLAIVSSLANRCFARFFFISPFHPQFQLIQTSTNNSNLSRRFLFLFFIFLSFICIYSV